jgi:hypothetical protein
MSVRSLLEQQQQRYVQVVSGSSGGRLAALAGGWPRTRSGPAQAPAGGWLLRRVAGRSGGRLAAHAVGPGPGLR